MQVVPQILNTFVGKVPVIVAPSELFSDVGTRLQRLKITEEYISNMEHNKQK